MKQTKYRLRFSVASLFIVIILGLLPSYLRASDNPNTITFNNQSGEYALAKLVGPTGQMVEVPNGGNRTVNVGAGEYYLLVRYGSKPETYTYSRGDPFTVTQTKTQYSVITITLHKVVGGNYSTHPISSKEFNDAPVASHNVDHPETIKTLTPVLPPPTIQLPPPTFHPSPPAIQLPPPTFQLPPPTFHLPPPAIHLPPPTTHMPPPTIQSPSPKEIEEKKEGTVK